MRMSMSMGMPKTLPLLHLPARGLDLIQPFFHQSPEKVVVVLGATGTGKSRLSIDLATRFPSEIINSDKMQVYKGLDIVTNKITDEESKGVPHHLLGIIDDTGADFTANNFSTVASAVTNSISRRRKLPIVVGGSNSFIEALVDDADVVSPEFCFLWIDVAMPVLKSFVSERVDRMVERGMVEEVGKMFRPECRDYSRGIRKSIGVPEFDRFFRTESFADEETRGRILEEAIRETKKNTCKLAIRQREKIMRLRTGKGWKIHRLDATEVFMRKRREEKEEEANKAWENLVVGPSTVIVNQFLSTNNYSINYFKDAKTTSSRMMMESAIAAKAK